MARDEGSQASAWQRSDLSSDLVSRGLQAGYGSVPQERAIPITPADAESGHGCRCRFESARESRSPHCRRADGIAKSTAPFCLLTNIFVDGLLAGDGAQ